MESSRQISSATVIRILKKIPLFFGLLDREYKQMTSVCHVVQYPGGTAIFHEGEPGYDMYVLLAGTVEIRTEKGGVLHVVQPGDIFGEIAVVTPLHRTATAQTLSDAALMRISRTEIDSLLGRAPRVSYLVMKHIAEVLAERLVTANNRLVDAQDWVG